MRQPTKQIAIDRIHTTRLCMKSSEPFSSLRAQLLREPRCNRLVRINASHVLPPDTRFPLSEMPVFHIRANRALSM